MRACGGGGGGSAAAAEAKVPAAGSARIGGRVGCQQGVQTAHHESPNCHPCRPGLGQRLRPGLVLALAGAAGGPRGGDLCPALQGHCRSLINRPQHLPPMPPPPDDAVRARPGAARGRERGGAAGAGAPPVRGGRRARGAWAGADHVARGFDSAAGMRPAREPFPPSLFPCLQFCWTTLPTSGAHQRPRSRRLAPCRPAAAPACGEAACDSKQESWRPLHSCKTHPARITPPSKPCKACDT